MTKTVNHIVHLEGTVAGDMAIIFTNAVTTYIPFIGNEIMNPEATGFRSMTLSYNPITKRYDASIYYMVSNRVIVHTLSSGCPAIAVANLMTTLLIMERKIQETLVSSSGDIQFKYTPDDDDVPDKVMETDHPF